MINVKNKLRVSHFPQIGSLKKSFSVEVKDEEQAYLISETLANQHLWLYKHKVIPDYSNSIIVEMYDESIDGWIDYWNEEEMMDWDEFEETYFKNQPV